MWTKDEVMSEDTKNNMFDIKIYRQETDNIYKDYVSVYNNLFVGLGSGRYISTSSDGFDWQKIEVMSTMGNITSIAYKNGTYVFGSPTNVSISTDNLSSFKSVLSYQLPNYVATDGSLFYVACQKYSGGYICKSSNGTSWEYLATNQLPPAPTNNPSNATQKMSSCGDAVIFGYQSGQPEKIYRIKQGEDTFQETNIKIIFNNSYKTRFVNNKYVIVTGTKIYISNDCTNFETINLPIDAIDIAYLNGYYIICPNNSSFIAATKDFEYWSYILVDGGLAVASCNEYNGYAYVTSLNSPSSNNIQLYVEEAAGINTPSDLFDDLLSRTSKLEAAILELQ